MVPWFAGCKELKDPDAVETRDRARFTVLRAAVAIAGSTIVTEVASVGKSSHLNLEVSDLAASVACRLLELLLIHALADHGDMASRL